MMGSVACSLPHRQLRKESDLKGARISVFTAAQAAQKIECCDCNSSCGFTAAQAAQKPVERAHVLDKMFTAAQAAQKNRSPK